MKPSITVDERGILLHVTNDAGEGIAIPLDPPTVVAMARQLGVARNKVLLARAALEMILKLTEGGDDGKGDG